MVGISAAPTTEICHLGIIMGCRASLGIAWTFPPPMHSLICGVQDMVHNLTTGWQHLGCPVALILWTLWGLLELYRTIQKRGRCLWWPGRPLSLPVGGPSEHLQCVLKMGRRNTWLPPPMCTDLLLLRGQNIGSCLLRNQIIGPSWPILITDRWQRLSWVPLSGYNLSDKLQPKD